MAVSQNLTLTKVADSQSIAGNTSKVRILWKSTQSGESYNSYTKTAYYWVTTPDGKETKYSVSYTLPKGTTKTILDKTITVTHKDDGSGTVKVRTWMDTGISAGEVSLSDSVTLDTIPRAAKITSAADVTLGNACKVKWTPAAASMRYKLEFKLSYWSYTTAVIHPNQTAAYTYNGYPLPVGLADYIRNGKTGTVTVTLYTYSDTGGTKQVGEADTTTFQVTVPELMPTVSMKLSAVSSLPELFAGLYVQGKSKVKADITASGQYGATIKSVRMEVEGKSYDGDFTSDYLNQYGSITVTAYATDSRGCTGSASQTIQVLSYTKPQILPATGESEVVAVRCDANGNPSDSGTYLKIKARRSYNEVTTGQVAYNACEIRYRYKAESASNWSAWATILPGNRDADEVETGAMLGGVLAADKSYLVQVGVIDDVGATTSTTVYIPTDRVYMHQDKVRRALAFGMYIQDDNCIDIAEDITVRVRGHLDVATPSTADDMSGNTMDYLKLGAKITATAAAPVSLNSIRTPGNYYSPNADNSQHITDSPYTAGGFSMTVRELQTASFIRQELFYGRTTWIRHFDGTAWSDWWRYQTTTVPETASADYVVETGNSGGWTWRKWKGGTYEMHGTFEVTPTSSTVQETLYRTNNMTIDVPFPISSAIVTGTAVGYYWITNGGISGTQKITLRLMGDKAFGTTAIEVRLAVAGTYP